MTYLNWVALYEGRGDGAYYDILLPRLMAEITTLEGVRHVEVPQAPALQLNVGREVDKVADKLCRNAESYHVIFIHADIGGRGLEAGMDAVIAHVPWAGMGSGAAGSGRIFGSTTAL